MAKIISFGKINPKYIIFVIIITVLKCLSFLIYDFSQKIEENKLLEIFLFYIGISLCIIPYYIIKKNSKGEIQNTQPKLLIEKEKEKKVTFLYGDIYDKKLALKDKILIIVLCLIFLTLDFSYLYEDYLNNKDDSIENYFFIENLAWFILPNLIFEFHYYKHQKLSIVFIIILGLINTIIAIIINLKFNYKKLFIDIFIYILETTSYAYIKGLIKYKYFSPFKIIYIVGFINLSLIIIIYFIVSHLPCNFEPLCEGKSHLDNIYSFRHFKFTEILLLSAYSIIIGFVFLLINLILYDFTLYHVLIPIHINYLIQVIIFQSNKTNLILTTLYFAFEIIFILVFLEIIELNFWGLNINLKKNIENRAISDSLYCLDDLKEKDENECIDVDDNYYIHKNPSDD